MIDAEPGATLRDRLQATRSIPRRCARRRSTGSIEDMLVWHPVEAGDFFYIPPNTVHAIGGGCSIIEIQQNSDITYRLYDYGRPRELHLESRSRWPRASRYSGDCRRRGRGATSRVHQARTSARPGRGLCRAPSRRPHYRGCLLVIPRRARPASRTSRSARPVRARAFDRRRGVRSQGKLPDRAALRGNER